MTNTRRTLWIAVFGIFIARNAMGADAPKPEPTKDERQAEVTLLENKTLEDTEKYTDCLQDYALKMYKQTASAGDIADGAAASCFESADRAASDEYLSRLKYRKLLGLGLDPAAPSITEIAQRLAAESRGATVNEVLQFRAKASGQK
jgi:hypothetical protein